MDFVRKLTIVFSNVFVISLTQTSDLLCKCEGGAAWSLVCEGR